jgi:phosphatidylglycerophosphatase A
MPFRDKSVLFLATGCFVGHAPFAPGTFGSLAALPLCYLMSGWSLAAGGAASFLFIAAAIRVAHRAEGLLGAKDPGCVVIDEIAGMLVTFVGVPLTPLSALAGFALFRCFDIVKPFPIRLVERKLSGGAGIVMDDVVAGIFANIALRLFLRIM